MKCFNLSGTLFQMGRRILGAFACSGFLRPKSAKLRKGDLRPKAREQNSATESSSLGKCQGYTKEARLPR